MQVRAWAQMCDFYVILLADASDRFAVCGRYFCWNFSVFLSSFVNLSILKAFPPSRTSSPNVSAWHQWDKIKSLTSELLVCFPCCHLKSALLYFLFMCWSSTRRLLFCRRTYEQRRGAGHQLLDQIFLSSCLHLRSHPQLSHVLVRVLPPTWLPVWLLR